jgi:uncharacterized iron-regulated membrane protein
MSSTELSTERTASTNKTFVGAVTLKPLLLKVHRWLALSIGIVIMVSAVTGVLLTLGKPLDRIVNASLFVGGPQQVPYQAFVDAVRTTYGPDTQVRLRFPAESGGTVEAYVKTKIWDGSAYFDPATAALVGARAKDEGFYNFILELHSDLFLHDVGEVILTVAGTAFIIMLITGLFLWWPRKWRFAFRVNFKGNVTALLFDGHRVAGAVFGLFVLVSVFTGTYLVWKPIATWVTAMAGQTPNKPPVLPKDPARKLLPDAPLDTILAHANVAVPGGRLVDITYPKDEQSSLRVRKHLEGDPHPNGQTYIWMNPKTAEVLKKTKWNEGDLGTRVQGWGYPYHSGRLFGTANLVFTGFIGLVLVWYGISGILLWWKRRRSR